MGYRVAVALRQAGARLWVSDLDAGRVGRAVAEMESRNFRDDLYYRLNVFNIHIPPLRERKEALPVLAQQILSRIAEQPPSAGDIEERLVDADRLDQVRESLEDHAQTQSSGDS